MEQLIKKIDELAKKYPSRIDLYPPITDDNLFKSSERVLGISLSEQLIQLYKYSNGMGFVDYCLFGLNNNKIADLVRMNFDILSDENDLEQKFIVFMSTSAGEDFGLVYQNEKSSYVIGHREDSMSIEYKIIASTVEEFFEKFLYKIEIVLQRIQPSDPLMYFDDESLPASLKEWN